MLFWQGVLQLAWWSKQAACTRRNDLILHHAGLLQRHLVELQHRHQQRIRLGSRRFTVQVRYR